MCSINGLISFSSNVDEPALDFLKSIIIKAEARGKDSFGYISYSKESELCKKYINKPSNILDKEFSIVQNPTVILNNNRAEPTTEFIEHKTINDVQPFLSKNCSVVHNGIIANDKEIMKEYNLSLNTSIDSAVIPFLFDDISKYDYDTPQQILRDKLIGSYSLAVYNKKTDVLYLATNYKPLYIAYDHDSDVLYFSSFEDYMVDTSNYDSVFKKMIYKVVEPYTLLIIHGNARTIKSMPLYKDSTNSPKKALVNASAGLDSTVAIAWALEQGYETELLHFNYKCRADDKEKKHIKLIAEYYNIPIINIDLDFLPDIIGNSNLFGNKKQINKDGGGIAGSELAIEWVPARNLMFMSIAAAYAEAHKFDYIILGGNLEESGAYSDNELLFQKKFNDLLPNSLNLQNRVQVLTPVANLMKKDIVELGLKLKAPLHLTWSCYENGDSHCGSCGPCFMRKTSFKMLGVDEVIKYKTDYE